MFNEIYTKGAYFIDSEIGSWPDEYNGWAIVDATPIKPVGRVSKGYDKKYQLGPFPTLALVNNKIDHGFNGKYISNMLCPKIDLENGFWRW